MGFFVQDDGFTGGAPENGQVDNLLDQCMEFSMISPMGDVVTLSIHGYVNPLNTIVMLAGMASPSRLHELGAVLGAPPPLVDALASGDICADMVFEATTGKSVQALREREAERYPIQVPDTPEGLSEN